MSACQFASAISHVQQCVRLSKLSGVRVGLGRPHRTAPEDAAQNARGGKRQRVRAALLAYLEHLEGNPPAARLFLVEMASISHAADVLISSSLDEFGCLLLEVMGRGSLSGDLSPLLLRGVVGGRLHVARAWIANGYTESLDEVADTPLRLYLLVG